MVDVNLLLSQLMAKGLIGAPGLGAATAVTSVSTGQTSDQDGLNKNTTVAITQQEAQNQSVTPAGKDLVSEVCH